MDENITNLDLEYEQFVEIMRPHISQLKNRELASICYAWIQRLCSCKGHEKILRNKYIVTLCYQLSKGILDKPFLEGPTEKDLVPIIEPTFSDISSSEVECLVLDSENTSKAKTKLFNTVNPAPCIDESMGTTMFNDKITTTASEANLLKQTSYYSQQSNMIKPDVEQLPENYRYRTHNIISRLQEIQNQNIMLHYKLKELKGKSSEESTSGDSQNLVSASNLSMRMQDSTSTLDSLKMRLKEVQDARNALIGKVQSMQEFINSMNAMKNQEIEEMQARHRLELINIKSFIKQETRQIYENKLEEQNQQFEVQIKELQDKTKKKDEIIAEKDKTIQQKESEIVRLTEQIKDNKQNLNLILKKFIDRPNEEQHSHFRIQNDILQNRMIKKMEKAKIKCVRSYESKLASLHRERHLVECSFQIQLVRQRAQIVNDVANDCQNDTKKAVNKLESKYQDIVANMQATAIQRRLEDQMAVSSILKAASGLRNDSYPFYTTMFPNSQPHLRMSKNRRSNADVTVFRGNKAFGNKIVNEKFGDEGRYEELGSLFEKVHGQRDAEDKAQK